MRVVRAAAETLLATILGRKLNEVLTATPEDTKRSASRASGSVRALVGSAS